MFKFALPFQRAPHESAHITNPQLHAIEPPGIRALTSQDHERFASASEDMRLILDAEGGIIYADSGLQALTGSKLDIQRCHFASLFLDEDRDAIRQQIQDMTLLAEGMGRPALTIEGRITGAEAPVWTRWQITAHGKETYCTGRNITAIKEAQAEVMQQDHQLREAESLGRLGRWRWTIGEGTIDLSAEIYRIWGVEADSFTTSLANIYNLIHEDDRDRMDQTLQRATINQNAFDIDFSITRPDGETRFIRCDGRCESNAEGEAIALYGIMQDVTEPTLYAHELKEAKDKAEHAYAAKSQFLANMSHELRTPLNAIIGFSEMMESQMFGPLGSDKYLDYAQSIRTSGAHLLDLISDILDMSKIEAGKYELSLQEANIGGIVHTAMEMIQTRADDKGVELRLSEALAQDQDIIADRRACLQIVLNILSNAVKFTPEGGRVEVSCKMQGDRARIKIADNGIGIPPSKLEAITRPFEQVQSHYTRGHEGSGLGLAITKELIEMHSGTLTIHSQIDMGTDVIVTLPVEQ